MNERREIVATLLKAGRRDLAVHVVATETSKEYPAKTSNPQVSGSITVYSDGSGAPAVLTYNGFKFACDYLGKTKVNRLGAGSGRESKKDLTVALSVVQKAYDELLHKHTDSGWMRQNHEMYR